MAKVNVIVGTPNNDILIGTPDKDAIYGGDGDDTLDGRQGKDELWGGAGRDTFLWSKYHHSQHPHIDSIMDFESVDFIKFGPGVYGALPGNPPTLTRPTWNDVTITDLGPEEYMVEVRLDGTNPLMIHVFGDRPAEANFIFFV